MDSDDAPGLPLGDLPHSTTPGAVPLRNARRERYAHARVLGHTPLAAAREAGFVAAGPADDPTAGLRGAAGKLERSKAVQARIQYLRGNHDDVLRRKHALAESVLVRVMTASMADFTQLTAAGDIALDMSAVANLSPDERRERLAVVKAVVPTQYGTKIELHSALDATAQYRALNGLDAPKRVEMSGPGGGPMETSHSLDLSRLTDDQLAAFADLYRAAAVSPGD